MATTATTTTSTRPDLWHELAQQLRVDSVRATSTPGSGHPTSAMSAADLIAVLAEKYLRYDFDRPKHPNNDHLIFSKGHASPLLYALYKSAGAIGDDELLSLRQFGSRLEGLDNLTVIADVNRLGQSGETMHGRHLMSYAERACSFGWAAFPIDGHDLESIDDAYAEAIRVTDRPSVIVAETRKGRGVAAVEDRPGWHGKVLPDPNAAIAELGGRRTLRIRVAAPRQGPTRRSYELQPTVLSELCSINVTLIFSLERYAAVVESYLRGLRRAADAGLDLGSIHSAASFFISRLDAAADVLLEQQRSPFALGLRGRLGIACAKLAYRHFEACFSGARWQALRAEGASPQRLLWASTSTKNPAYRDVRYVEELIGPQTVTTLPLATLEAFEEHGRVAETLARDVERAALTLDDLALAGLDLARLTDELERDGIDQFARSLHALEARIGASQLQARAA